MNFKLYNVQNGVISNVHNDTNSKLKDLTINETRAPCPGPKSVITSLSWVTLALTILQRPIIS